MAWLTAARGLPVGQPVLLDVVAVGLEQHAGAAQLPDLLLGPLDHAMALARLGKQHLAGAGNLEALFSARLGLDLGHLALLIWPQTRAKGPVHRHKLEIERLCACLARVRTENRKSTFPGRAKRTKPPPRQPFSRAAEGRGYGRGAEKKHQSVE